MAEEKEVLWIFGLLTRKDRTRDWVVVDSNYVLGKGDTMCPFWPFATEKEANDFALDMKADNYDW